MNLRMSPGVPWVISKLDEHILSVKTFFATRLPQIVGIKSRTNALVGWRLVCIPKVWDTKSSLATWLA